MTRGQLKPQHSLVFKGVAILFLICLWHCEGIATQAASTSPLNPISASIYDPRGEAVPDAAVLIEDGKQTWKFHSDGSGKFKAELPAGIYTVTLEKTGFKKCVYRAFQIEPSQLYYQFQLEVGDSSTTVVTRIACIEWAMQSTPPNQVTDAQKKEFIELLKTLPHKGEFFTDEAVKKAGPYLPVLFALTEKDIAGYDIYPFAALSRGLCDDKEHRRYATAHFAEIQHPQFKLFWGAMLFDAGDPAPEIVVFLRDALKSDAQAKVLAEIIGPDFADFKKRVNEPDKN